MMSLHKRYGLKQVINAWGTASRYGVSRSAPEVAADCAEALGNYYDMLDLERIAGELIAQCTGAPWGCVTHCTAAAITLSVAAAMTAKDADKIMRLPDSSGMNAKILIQAGHQVNYGGSIVQAIALAGGHVIALGSPQKCVENHITEQLECADVAALVFVDSHLAAQVGQVSLARVIALARPFGVPVILDAAAQDFRMKSLVASGADLVLLSAQKYLAAPTAGIVAGKRELVEAVALQHQGIGRAMKPSKESIFGVMSALQVRASQGVDGWAAECAEKVATLSSALSELQSLKVTVVPDPTGCPFSRVRIQPIVGICPLNAVQLAHQLAVGTPVIAVGAHYAERGFLNLEVGGLTKAELILLVDRIKSLVAGSRLGLAD